MSRFDVLMIGSFPEDRTLIQGGVQASVYGLCAAFERNMEIRRIKVFAPPTEVLYRAREQAFGRLDIRYLNTPWRFQFTNVLHVFEILREAAGMRRPVAHVHGTGLLQFALCLIFTIRRRPLVWTLHGITEKECLQRFRDHRSLGNFGRYLLYRGMERIMLRMVADIIVDTPYVRAALGPCDRAVHVIPQGVFLDEFHARANALPRMPLVLSVGVIDPRKGHHLTLRAFARILPRFPNARLAIVGILRIAAYYEELVATAAELGISESVDFRPNLSRRQILDLLGTASVFALHSQEESQGIALCEALAAGLPVVSTKIGGIPYVVTDQQDGFLVEYGDVDGFAAAIARLLGDPDLHDRMATQAVIASRRFSWAHAAGEVAALYGSLLETAEPLAQRAIAG